MERKNKTYSDICASWWLDRVSEQIGYEIKFDTIEQTTNKKLIVSDPNTFKNLSKGFSNYFILECTKFFKTNGSLDGYEAEFFVGRLSLNSELLKVVDLAGLLKVLPFDGFWRHGCKMYCNIDTIDISFPFQTRTTLFDTRILINPVDKT